MIVGIQLYSSLSLLARQSMLMLTELPGKVTVFEQFFHLEYSDSYTCNIHHYCICHSQDTAFETLLALNYNSFILTVAIIGAGIYSIEAGEYNVFDSYANSHSEGTCVLLEIPSMHKLVQYFQTLHRNEDIYELKRVHVATFEPHLFSSNENIVVYQVLIVTNVPVNSAALWQFMQCVTLLLILVDTGLKELYLSLLVTGIHCTMRWM